MINSGQNGDLLFEPIMQKEIIKRYNIFCNGMTLRTKRKSLLFNADLYLYYVLTDCCCSDEQYKDKYYSERKDT